MVSVIIPNYNHGSFLKQRIDSVLNQTYQHIEVILLDDCSTDNSRDIIETYRNHPKINIIVYNDKNSGSTFLQWEKGIELAKGEWIWIAESDDWCENSLLQELINGARNHSGCTLSFCQSIVFRENEILSVTKARKIGEYVDGKTFTAHMVKDNMIVNASMCIFKRSEYFKVSQEFTNYKFLGDCLFWIELVFNGKVYVSGKTLNYFRKHTNDVTSKALLSGLYYSEYLNLLMYVDRKYQIIGHKMSMLLLERFKLLLRDDKITHPSRKEIKQLYKNKLGLDYYLELSRFYKTIIRQRAHFKKP